MGGEAMPRRTTVAALGSFVIAGAAVVPSSAVASPLGDLTESVTSCIQSHVSAVEDDIAVGIRVSEKRGVKKKPKHRHHGHGAKQAAVKPATGATVSATLTGPYVTNGHASGKTDATGTAALKLMISGPGTYTLSLSVTKAGDKPASVTKTINISGPMNGACSIS
jgi:hypothetical protein